MECLSNGERVEGDTALKIGTADRRNDGVFVVVV